MRPWASSCCPTPQSDPDDLLLRFLQSTFDAAATLGNWPAVRRT